jgi:hypothetical protein
MPLIAFEKLEFVRRNARRGKEVAGSGDGLFVGQCETKPVVIISLATKAYI